MENQHRSIAGYRELDPADIDLMNRIKVKGAELLALHTELVQRLDNHGVSITATNGVSGTTEAERFLTAEPYRWAAIGKTDIQTGVMALVRAVAQPSGI